MADTKISALTADTTPTTDDLVVTVNDPGGTPTNKKVTIGNLLSLIAGNLLTYVYYNPAILADVTTTSTTGADVDATNLAVTFTVPLSGKVRIVQTARAYQSTSAYYWWNLRDTSGNNIANTRGMVDGNSSVDGRKTHVMYITGLTPGASVTYRWGFGVSSGTAHILYGDAGGTSPIAGPAVMEVFSAP